MEPGGNVTIGADKLLYGIVSISLYNAGGCCQGFSDNFRAMGKGKEGAKGSIHAGIPAKNRIIPKRFLQKIQTNAEKDFVFAGMENQKCSKQASERKKLKIAGDSVK